MSDATTKRTGTNPGTPSHLPRPDFRFPGQIGRTYLESDPAQFPQPVHAPEGAPNILLILIDDCGFGQYGTFGGGIASPTMDRLAAEGLRYNCFHTTAATGATHAPHHTPKEWIEKFKGRFDEGWDTYRELTIARQKNLGVIPKDTELTVRSKGLPAWDSLNADQKRLYARMMEVFAGYAAHCDHELGRVVDACKALPGSENTLIVYIAGDNGASAEGGLEGSLCENMFFNGFPEKWQDNIKAIDELGGPKHFNHFPSAWAHAMNTPFQWTKQVASHFGGTRNPLIISWPARIKDKGGLRPQFLHVIDLVPTIYEVCGITAPAELNGVQQKPIEGVSFAFTFEDAKAPTRRKTQYFELGCNRGLYHDGWMASSPSFVPWDPNRQEWDPDKAPWELYEVGEDFSQARDLAAKHPEKLRELQDMWWVEAAKYQVLPLDWRGVERFNSELMGRPSLVGHRTDMTYYPGTIGLPDAAAPPMCNKSFTITAQITVPDGGAHGMVVTHGGLEGGYGLYLRDSTPTFVYNFLSVERTTLTANDALPIGKVRLVVDFKYDGGGLGKGGVLTMTANGKKIAEGRLARTIPMQFSLGEGLDIGMDVGSPIDFTYTLPFAFTGTIDQVTIALGQPAAKPAPTEEALAAKAGAEMKVALAKH